MSGEPRLNVDNPGHRAIAEPNTVLLGLVGSTVHGVTVDAADDRDEMGICIEPPEYVAGLRPFSQWVFRTQPEGARSGPGDIDRTVYSLRKWCRLALSGNPTVMLLLHTPDEHCSILESRDGSSAPISSGSPRVVRVARTSATWSGSATA